jgi:hypothetical protein
MSRGEIETPLQRCGAGFYALIEPERPARPHNQRKRISVPDYLGIGLITPPAPALRSRPVRLAGNRGRDRRAGCERGTNHAHRDDSTERASRRAYALPSRRRPVRVAPPISRISQRFRGSSAWRTRPGRSQLRPRFPRRALAHPSQAIKAVGPALATTTVEGRISQLTETNGTIAALEVRRRAPMRPSRAETPTTGSAHWRFSLRSCSWMPAHSKGRRAGRGAPL